MESDAGLGYLAVAYGVFFVALFSYVLRLHRRHQDLSQQVDALHGQNLDNSV